MALRRASVKRASCGMLISSQLPTAFMSTPRNMKPVHIPFPGNRAHYDRPAQSIQRIDIRTLSQRMPHTLIVAYERSMVQTKIVKRVLGTSLGHRSKMEKEKIAKKQRRVRKRRRQPLRRKPPKARFKLFFLRETGKERKRRRRLYNAGRKKMSMRLSDIRTFPGCIHLASPGDVISFAGCRHEAFAFPNYPLRKAEQNMARLCRLITSLRHRPPRGGACPNMREGSQRPIWKLQRTCRLVKLPERLASRFQVVVRGVQYQYLPRLVASRNTGHA